MRKKHGVILAVIGYIVFFFCMEGWGADWKYIGADDLGNVLEIDAVSISRQPNNIVRAWFKTTHSEKRKSEWINKLGIKYKDLSYSKVLSEYHCTENKIRILSSIHYSMDGSPIGSSNSPNADWEFVIPDSTGEILFKVVCK